MSQLAFDLDAMIHEMDVATAPAWDGAPLHFTATYWEPTALDAAWERYIFENGHFNSISASHMWHRPAVPESQLSVGIHTLDRFQADLGHGHRCHGFRRSNQNPCTCVGSGVYMAVCATCCWHAITPDEGTALEQWHDHVMPGWRGLPVAPTGRRNSQSGKLTRAGRSFLDNYPTVWSFDGAPILTTRGAFGHRHVPGRSPFGGYDIASEAVR
ncbi:DUF6349 family protein [Leifsonia aquatica]|uniref:DUF6349 family protein n=1 Tax=Leifsonia aquatica TaxID=144185 RepID=UPI00384C945E